MRPLKIGYAKLGRSMPLRLDKCGSLGGDNEMVPTVKMLAERHPNVEFVLIGRNSGENPVDVGLPANVTNPWIEWGPQVRTAINAERLSYANLTIPDHIRVKNILHEITGPTIRDMDGIVMWLGQHGTTNTPLPSIKDRGVLTKPYDWATLYASYLLQGINTWRDVKPDVEEVLLNADVRNYVKYRDGKWPWHQPVLGQYNQVNAVKHEQGDRVVESTIQTVYSRLEISSLIPGTPFGDTIRFNDNYYRPHDFGIVFNETRREVSYDRSRRRALKEWVLPNSPGFVRGKWSDKTVRELQISPIEPVPLTSYIDVLQSTLCTLTTPASGSGWATAKAWEAFAAGVVCFFHPAYDDQDNILKDAPYALSNWLRVPDPLELRDRIRYTCDNPEFWRSIVRLQRDHFEAAVAEKRYLHEIERRLNLC